MQRNIRTLNLAGQKLTTISKIRRKNDLQGGRQTRKKSKKHSKLGSEGVTVPPVNAPSSVPVLNNLLNKPTENQNSLNSGGCTSKSGIVASHSLPPQPSRPISTATAAPIKKSFPVKSSDVSSELLTSASPNPVNTLSKPGVPSVTPIQIKAPGQQAPSQPQIQPSPQQSLSNMSQLQQPQPQAQPQLVPSHQTPSQITVKQSDLSESVAILPSTLADLESHLDMNVATSPSSLPIVSNSMTNPSMVPMLNEADVFQHPIVLKTPASFSSTTSLPASISHSNGYPSSEIKIESPPNVGGILVGVPSVFDPITLTKEEKPGVTLPPTPEENKPNPGNSSSNFASAFKTKPPNMTDNLKNASSWSSLAQASSPHNALGGNASSMKNAMDSFQAFKKQAKEKADRQRALIEQQEIRRLQKEQAEKERIRIENERRREREEEEALEKARKAVAEQQQQLNRVEDVKSAAQEESSSPNHGGSDKSVAERERQRLREQERRRREALAGQIDMNMQSDLMAAFEESL